MTLDFLRSVTLGILRLKMDNFGGGVEIKVTHKSLKVTIYWHKMTEYSVLNYSYIILEYYTAIIRTHSSSLPEFFSCYYYLLQPLAISNPFPPFQSI